MTLHTRPFLLFAMISTMMLVSSDGDGIVAPPNIALNKLIPASDQASDPPPVPKEQPASAKKPDAAPAQTPVPKKASSLSDEVKRIHRERLACVAEPATSADIFASKSWYVPPPPPPPAPPPPPTAPPLPFSFVGSYQDPDGRLILFLSKGDRMYTVSPGDVIDGTYRVEDVVAGQLGLVYLPMNIKQTLTVGEAS